MTVQKVTFCMSVDERTETDGEFSSPIGHLLHVHDWMITIWFTVL